LLLRLPGEGAGVAAATHDGTTWRTEMRLAPTLRGKNQ
jgi:hypothetical protein